MAAEIEEVVVDANPFAPSTSLQISARSSSASVRGARYSVAGAAIGSGSALRSTLPFGVSGSASRRTKTDGTMYSGSRSCSASRRRAGSASPTM